MGCTTSKAEQESSSPFQLVKHDSIKVLLLQDKKRRGPVDGRDSAPLSIKDVNVVKDGYAHYRPRQPHPLLLINKANNKTSPPTRVESCVTDDTQGGSSRTLGWKDLFTYDLNEDDYIDGFTSPAFFFSQQYACA